MFSRYLRMIGENISFFGIFAKLFCEMVKLLRQLRCHLLYKQRREFLLLPEMGSISTLPLFIEGVP